MKAFITFFAIILCCVNASFNNLDLSSGGRYLVNGTFQGWTNLTGEGAPSFTIWAQDASTGRYFQDLQSGGQYYYYPNGAYAVRNGFCFIINEYNSSTLLSSYGSALSYQFDDHVDNRTYMGMGASTCRTPLANLFKMNSNGVMRYWVFQQLSPELIPEEINVCLNVQGQIDFTNSNVMRHFDDSIFDLPSSCLSPVGDYCRNFYFQSGQQCNYRIY